MKSKGDKPFQKDTTAFDSCPHCGRKLSPWEQVLLSVDRALMCKGCWYRIILDVFDPPPSTDRGKKSETKE